MSKEFRQTTWDDKLQRDLLTIVRLAIDEDLAPPGRLDHPGPGGGGRGRAGGGGGTAAGRGRGAAGGGIDPCPGCLGFPLATPNRGRPSRRKGRVRGHDRRAGPRTARRRADPAELFGPAVGHCHADAAIRRCGGRHEGPHLRHPQNHPRLAEAGEVRRALRRRMEPSQRIGRGRVDQGQSPGHRRPVGRRPTAIRSGGSRFSGPRVRRPSTGAMRRW